MVHVHFDPEPVDTVIRLPSATELHCLQNFQAHVSTCSVCRRSSTPVVRYHLLCAEGNKTATAVCQVLVARKGKICAVKATRLPYDVVVEVPQTFWTARALLQDYLGTVRCTRSVVMQHRIDGNGMTTQGRRSQFSHGQELMILGDRSCEANHMLRLHRDPNVQPRIRRRDQPGEAGIVHFWNRLR